MTQPIRLERRTDEQRAQDAENVTVIFSVDDRDYSIPNRTRPHISYGYLRRLAKDGEEAAGAWLISAMLGDEALEALEALGDDLTEEQNDALMERVREIALGGATAPKAH